MEVNSEVDGCQDPEGDEDLQQGRDGVFVHGYSEVRILEALKFLLLFMLLFSHVLNSSDVGLVIFDSSETSNSILLLFTFLFLWFQFLFFFGLGIGMGTCIGSIDRSESMKPLIADMMMKKLFCNSVSSKAQRL